MCEVPDAVNAATKFSYSTVNDFPETILDDDEAFEITNQYEPHGKTRINARGGEEFDISEGRLNSAFDSSFSVSSYTSSNDTTCSSRRCNAYDSNLKSPPNYNPSCSYDQIFKKKLCKKIELKKTNLDSLSEMGKCNGQSLSGHVSSFESKSIRNIDSSISKLQ